MRIFNVKVNGNNYVVEVEETGAAEICDAPVAAPIPAVQAVAPVQPAPVKPVAPAQPAPAPASKAASADGTVIKCPMPGMVLAFKVANGSVVKKHQAVLVLEAMKMENDIAAPCEGTITFITSKGANVNTGDILAVIK